MVEQTITIFGGLALFNLAILLPVLLSSSVRRLFQKLPTENLAANYVIGVTAFTLLHSLALLSVIIGTGGLEGTSALWGPGLVTIGTGITAWLAISLGLPHLNYWQPKETENELDGRIALALGLIWYTVNTATTLLLLMIIAIALYFPG